MSTTKILNAAYDKLICFGIPLPLKGENKSYALAEFVHRASKLTDYLFCTPDLADCMYQDWEHKLEERTVKDIISGITEIVVLTVVVGIDYDKSEKKIALVDEVVKDLTDTFREVFKGAPGTVMMYAGTVLSVSKFFDQYKHTGVGKIGLADCTKLTASLYILWTIVDTSGKSYRSFTKALLSKLQDRKGADE